MVNVAEIVLNIYSYLRGDSSLESFRDWMVRSELELESSPENNLARQLVWQLEARYAELSDDIVDLPSWKRILRQLAEDQRSGSEPVVLVSLLVTTQNPQWPFYTVTPTANSLAHVEPDLVAA